MWVLKKVGAQKWTMLKILYQNIVEPFRAYRCAGQPPVPSGTAQDVIFHNMEVQRSVLYFCVNDFASTTKGKSLRAQRSIVWSKPSRPWSIWKNKLTRDWLLPHHNCLFDLPQIAFKTWALRAMLNLKLNEHVSSAWKRWRSPDGFWKAPLYHCSFVPRAAT